MFGNDTLSTVLVAGFVVLLAVAGAGGAAVGVAAAQSGPSIGFSGVEDVSEGSTDGATVTFADVSGDGVGSFTVNVTYDPSAVSLSASGTGEFSVETATPEPGVLRVTGYTDEYPGPTGNGSLFGLSVTGESADDSVSLGLEAETFTDADGTDIAVSTGSATLAVEADDGDGGDGGDGGGGGGGGQPGGGADGEVEITDRTLLNDTVTTGEAVVAQVALANYDPVDGRFSLTLSADGATVDERTVTVGASSQRTVQLRTRFGTAGTYSLAVNGASIGSVTVEAGATPTPTQGPGTPTSMPTETPPPTATPEPTTPDPSTPTGTATEPPETTTTGDGAGFGVFAALVAVGLAAIGARRRL